MGLGGLRPRPLAYTRVSGLNKPLINRRIRGVCPSRGCSDRGFLKSFMGRGGL